MRKIPIELENPIDNKLIAIGAYLAPFFKKLNLTPNHLTTISFVTALISIYFYRKGNYLFSAISLFISYAFDCFDGFYARKYKMETKFGDYYDHISDLITGIILFYFIFKKYLTINTFERYIPFITLIFLFTLSLQLSCQEKYFEKNNNNKGYKYGDSLNFLRSICPVSRRNKLYNVMKINRFFGCGTYYVFILFLILYSYRIDKSLIYYSLCNLKWDKILYF